MTDIRLGENERIDDLQRGGLRIIVNQKRFRYGTDAVLLADFAQVPPRAKICDLGTGTGVLPLLIGARVDGTVFDAVELQKDMCDMARRSAALNGFSDRVKVHNIDLKDAAVELGLEQYDAVVSNPPYGKMGAGMLPPDEALAIARFEVKCTFNDVARAAFRLLKNGGKFYFVHRVDRMMELMDTVRLNRLAPKRVRCVHSSVDGEGILVLMECVKNGENSLRWLPPLIIYDADGQYTPEARRIYGEERTK